jgi:hypothetical protein
MVIKAKTAIHDTIIIAGNNRVLTWIRMPPPHILLTNSGLTINIKKALYKQ